MTVAKIRFGPLHFCLLIPLTRRRKVDAVCHLSKYLWIKCIASTPEHIWWIFKHKGFSDTCEWHDSNICMELFMCAHKTTSTSSHTLHRIIPAWSDKMKTFCLWAMSSSSAMKVKWFMTRKSTSTSNTCDRLLFWVEFYDFNSFGKAVLMPGNECTKTPRK